MVGRPKPINLDHHLNIYIERFLYKAICLEGDQNQMRDNKLGGFQDRKDLRKIFGHSVSKNEFGMITNQGSTIDKDISAHVCDLSQKTGLEKTETKTFVKTPGGKEDERKIGEKTEDTDFGLLIKDSMKGFESLKDAGLVHHGPVKSKTPIMIVLEATLSVFRYKNLRIPILENIDSEKLVNGANILLKNNERETGKKLPSLDIVKLLHGVDAFLDNCFVDGITEEFKGALVKEICNELFPLVINLITNKPDETLDMIFKRTAVFHFIYAIRRIEKERGIKILKANSELMEIVGIKKTRYYKNLNLIESKFLRVSP